MHWKASASTASATGSYPFFFNKRKEFWRIATCHEVLAANYLARIEFTVIRMWLRSL